MRNIYLIRKWRNIIKKSGLFDLKYYLFTYPDVRHADLEPIFHYIKHGAKEGRNPSEVFNTNFYLEHNHDIKIKGINPLVHYILSGNNEGRIKNINEFSMQLIEKSNLFDEKFYLLNYPEVKDTYTNPIEHFVMQGASKGYNPSENFDTLVYLNQHHIFKDSLINPLAHSILHCNKENYSSLPLKDLCFDTNTSVHIEKIDFDKTKDEFVDFKLQPTIKPTVKTIAFYLPQFHPFPENDEWWGKGFTEWTNVTKARPNYTGHYHPHLPIHNGFYDLRLPEVLIEQSLLAKQYGIYGFAFYYYWFDGKILMHKPLENLLKHTEIDIPFCFCWANENWTRRWDGQDHDILITQNHSEQDSESFIESLFKYFDDKRYIRVDNKPVLILYRADIIPNIKLSAELWRKKAVEHGLDGLYLISAQSFGIQGPEKFGFDASVEFPPHTVKSQEIDNTVNLINSSFSGKIFSYDHVVDNELKKEEPNYKLFRTCMLSWDNTARKQDASHIFSNFSLLKYKQWLSHIVNNSYNNTKYSKNEKIVFINAWNEWAEGTHLEPDQKYGYGYLQATYDVLKNYDDKYYRRLNNEKLVKRNNIAVILHIHYTELWEQIEPYLSNLIFFGFDLYITITNTDNNIIDKITNSYSNANIKLVENRGRDILPFIDTFKNIKKLNYKYICKLHSKKSEYRKDGNKIRNDLYTSLLGSKNTIKTILNIFDSNNTIGLVCDVNYLIEHTDLNITHNKEIIYNLTNLLGLKFEYSFFPAGSMFWFTPNALNDIDKVTTKHFKIEEGLIDGTVAHGIERLFCNIAKNNNYQTKSI